MNIEPMQIVRKIDQGSSASCVKCNQGIADDIVYYRDEQNYYAVCPLCLELYWDLLTSDQQPKRAH